MPRGNGAFLRRKHLFFFKFFLVWGKWISEGESVTGLIMIPLAIQPEMHTICVFQCYYHFKALMRFLGKRE